ncbi:MAG: hypothetical protein ACI3ZE_03125 [Candidatus Woodwardiibium sp.]
MKLAELGGGSTLFGLLLILFAAIALVNLGIGCLLTVERILKTFQKKPEFWMYVYIIVTSIGAFAMKEILSHL